jgi:hypothetical protein
MVVLVESHTTVAEMKIPKDLQSRRYQCKHRISTEIQFILDSWRSPEALNIGGATEEYILPNPEEWRA